MAYGTRQYGARAYGDSALGGGPATSAPGGTTQTIAVGGIASAEAVGAPNVFGPQRITVASILDEPRVGEPTITLPAAVDAGSRLVVRLAHRATPTVPALELDEAFGRSWQDVHNGEGTGRVLLADDDPDLAAVAYFDVLRFELDGATRFAAVVERKARASIAAGEEVDEVTEVTGRGVAAVLEDGVVYPERGLDLYPFGDTRVFNFAAADLDDTGWAAPIETTIALYGRNPVGWPDPAAVFLWDRPQLVDGDGLAGDMYFRHAFTAVAGMTAEVWIDADDEYDLWLDGLPLLSDRFTPDTSGTPEKARVSLSAGEHLIAVRVANLNNLKGGLILTVLELAADNTTVGVVTNTGSTGWKGLAYPAAPPGFTPGAVIRLLIDEAQARGALAGVTTSFSDGADTSGAAWPITADLAFPVGADLLAVLKQLAETYLDWHMTPNLRLDAWAERGSTSTAAFTAGTNITSLDHEGQV